MLEQTDRKLFIVKVAVGGNEQPPISVIATNEAEARKEVIETFYEDEVVFLGSGEAPFDKAALLGREPEEEGTMIHDAEWADWARLLGIPSIDDLPGWHNA